MLFDKAELKRRNLLRIAGARDNKVYIGPKDVILGLGNKCNLNCKFCYCPHAPGNPIHFDKAWAFSWEKFLGIVRDCVDLKVDQIMLTASGEPTLHPLFPDMMHHLGQQPLYVRLITNGTFPLKYCSDVIKGDRVVINLSAVNRQQYRDIHGQDHFDRVVRNIKRLVSLRDAGKSGFRIGIAYIENAINIKQKPKMQKMVLELGVNDVFFKEMHPRPYNDPVAVLSKSKASKNENTPRICLNGWFQLVIGPDTMYSLCCQIKPNHPIDFEKCSLKEFWLSKQMMKMRLLIKKGHVLKKYKDCQTCQSSYKNSERLKDVIEFRKNEKAIA